MRALWMAMFLTGCLPSSVDEDETGDTEPDAPSTEYQGCEELEIRTQGPDAPAVGDSWSVLLYCDGALLTGPLVLRFDPPDFADVSDNTVTFTQAGTAEMRVQVGSQRQTMDVTVTES